MVGFRKGATQKDLARRLGVSQSLVSRVLSGKSEPLGVSSATARRIRHAARAAGYRPSPLAVALRGGSTRLLGVVVKDFDDPFFGYVIGELQTLARRHLHTLLLTGQEPGDLAALGEYVPGGLLILGSDYEPEGLEAYLARGRRAVRVGWGAPREGVDQVMMDDAVGLGLLLNHLAGLGHRRIGFVGAESALQQRRGDLLRGLLDERGWGADAAFYFFALPAAEAGQTGLNRIWSLPPEKRPTAIVAADDLVAQGVLRAAANRGLSAPSHFSLAGIDDLPQSALSVPALTTLRQPIRRMIRSAFACLLKANPGAPKDVRVRPELMLRESTGPVPGPVPPPGETE